MIEVEINEKKYNFKEEFTVADMLASDPGDVATKGLSKAGIQKLELTHMIATMSLSPKLTVEEVKKFGVKTFNKIISALDPVFL